MNLFLAQTQAARHKLDRTGSTVDPSAYDAYLSEYETIRKKIAEKRGTDTPDEDKIFQELGLHLSSAFDIKWGALREFVVYIMFLSLFTVVLLSSRPNQYTFFFRDRLNNELFESPPSEDVTNTFDGVDTWNKFWYWINGDPSKGLPGPFRSTVWQQYHYGNVRAEPGLIMDSDIVVGGIRFRQCRVDPQPCETPPGFENRPMVCSPRFSSDVESTKAYGPNNRFKYSSNYTWLKILAPAMYWGIVDNYGGGGFSVDIPWNDGAKAEAIFNELIDDQWVDDKTRAVYIDFSMYDPNSQLFGVVQILFEFLYTGGVMPSYTLYSVRIFRYITSWDHFVMVLEILFVLFLFYFIFIEIKEIVLSLRKSKDDDDSDNFWDYIKDFWNWVDWINISIFLVVITIRIGYLIRLSAVQTTFDVNRMDYVDLLPLAYWQETETNINAINGFLCYLKIFKYIRVIPRMDSLFATLALAAKDILLFLIMFFIVFFGFVASFYVCFSSKLSDFRSVSQSSFSLLRTIMGDFDFLGLQDANRFMGPILFISFQILVFFFLVNMFLAIVNNAYAGVQKDTDEVLKASIRFKVTMNNLKALGNRYLKKWKRKFGAGRNRSSTLEGQELEEYDQMTDDQNSIEQQVHNVREHIRRVQEADKSHEKIVEQRLLRMEDQLMYLEELIVEQAKATALKIIKKDVDAKIRRDNKGKRKAQGGMSDDPSDKRKNHMEGRGVSSD